MSDKVQTISPKVLEAMARIEQEAREKFQSELGQVIKKPPIQMNTSTYDELEELPAASNVTPRENIPALRGAVNKVTKINTDQPVVHGPSANSMAAGAKREARLQLERIEAAELAAEARKSFTPERLHADLRAKERLIAKQAKQIKEILKRLESLEGGA